MNWKDIERKYRGLNWETIPSFARTDWNQKYMLGKLVSERDLNQRIQNMQLSAAMFDIVSIYDKNPRVIFKAGPTSSHLN
jgi:hypothetical protein